MQKVRTIAMTLSPLTDNMTDDTTDDEAQDTGDTHGGTGTPPADPDRLLSHAERVAFAFVLADELAALEFGPWCQMAQAAARDPLLSVAVDAYAILHSHMPACAVAAHVLGASVATGASAHQENAARRATNRAPYLRSLPPVDRSDM